ncbi:MAG: ABC transporter permease [Clostridia bacterium]|nr:ABC transporter permease [Clostridia bacterium]
MTQLICLIKRNSKLFFKDVGMFVTSLITPLILLVLYTTFLGNVYRDSFASSIPQGFAISEKLLGGAVAAQLFASLLAVSCITVSFCANMLMVQDKANDTALDIAVSPIKPSKLALGYYISTLASTLIICVVAMLVSFIYIGNSGWYLSFSDVLLICLDVFLLVMLGTALSSVINFFLSTQGQISAVGTVVSSCYGFISGAYMPLSQLSEVIRNAVMFLPGTYGTSLLKNHAMRGIFSAMADEGIPTEAIEGIKDSIDCNLYFFDKPVSMSTMYAVMSVSVLLLVGVYIILNVRKNKK